MQKKKIILYWGLASVFTLIIALYQRLTGPTYPIRGRLNVGDSSIRYRLPRSSYASNPVTLRIVDGGKGMSGELFYKRFRTDDSWSIVEMKRKGDALESELPGRPAAAKLEYCIKLRLEKENWILNQGKALILRFKNPVPAWLLILHILFMFAGLLFSIRTGLEAMRPDGRYNRLLAWTLFFTLIGGLLLGPLVQKYAFGNYWSGFPFGKDLTDNKTLLTALFWGAAFLLRKKHRGWVITAAVLMLLIYLIPHSLFGSELNYRTGRIETGSISVSAGTISRAYV